MIEEHSILGNKENSFHDFTFTQSGMSIYLSTGSYWRTGVLLHEVTDLVTLDIVTPAEDTMYEVWICSDGICVFSAATETPIDYQFNGEPIDRLCWFTVLAGATTLDDIPIHVLKMVESE